MKGGERFTLIAVAFDGHLTVEDAALFQETLITSIGAGKAFGMGMLSVAAVGTQAAR